MNLAYRRGLPAVLAAALAVGVVGVGTPALAAEAAPTGTYTLDSASIWTGQQVKITQTELDDDDVENAAIIRTINWGDGTTVTADAGDTSWTHKYAETGSFPVSVTLSDGTVSGPGTVTGGPAVTVGAVPGTYGWQKNRIYTYPGFLNEAVFTASGVPASSNASWVTWGDDETTLLRDGATANVDHYFGEGTHTPQVELQNAQGKSAPRNASPLTVALDTTAPSVALTYPASPNKASSYKAMKGTAKDSQSGPDVVGIWLYKANRTSEYYFDFDTKKWIKVNANTEVYAHMVPVTSSGTWSVPVSGLAKGWVLSVGIYGCDKVGNCTPNGQDKWAQITLNS